MKKAVITILHNTKDNTYLLLERSPNHRYANQLCLPGGKLDFLNEVVKEEVDHSSTLGRTIQTFHSRWESYEEAAIRECVEETGYLPLKMRDLGIFLSDGEFIVKVFYCNQYKHLNEVIYPNREHQCAKWVSQYDTALLNLPIMTHNALNSISFL